MKKRNVTKTLRQAIQDLAPLVKSLVSLEHDLLGIDLQYAGIPKDVEGPDQLLDGLQRKADARYRQIVGKAAADRASHEECRRIIECLNRLAWFAGGELDTAALPVTAPVWTSDDGDDESIVYDPIPDGAPRKRTSSRYRLTTKVRLNHDGSLARR